MPDDKARLVTLYHKAYHHASEAIKVLPLGFDGSDYQQLLTNGTGRLQVDVITGGGGGGSGTEVIEDDVHVNPTNGPFVLGVRRDADTTPVTADNDNHPLVFDDAGNLKVNVKASVGGGGGSGTEYTEGTDPVAGGEGTLILGDDPTANVGRAPSVVVADNSATYNPTDGEVKSFVMAGLKGPNLTNSTAVAFKVDNDGQQNVTLEGGGALSPSDPYAFPSYRLATQPCVPVSGVPGATAAGGVAAPASTLRRGMHVNLRDEDGVEITPALEDGGVLDDIAGLLGTIDTDTGTLAATDFATESGGNLDAIALALTTGPVPVTESAPLTGFALEDGGVLDDISGKLPSVIGQNAKADSLSVTLASDQEDVKVSLDGETVAVTGTFWQTTQPVSGSVTADTELPAAVVLGATVANPTTPMVGAAAMVFNGTTWTRLASGSGTVGTGTPRMTLGSNDPAVTALQIMDDWDESDRAKVNPIAGQAGVQGGSGTVTALTQRVVLATDVALPAGTNAIGKIAPYSLNATYFITATANDIGYHDCSATTLTDTTWIKIIDSNALTWRDLHISNSTPFPIEINVTEDAPTDTADTDVNFRLAGWESNTFPVTSDKDVHIRSGRLGASITVGEINADVIYEA